MSLISRYLDHTEAETRLANKVALVVGGNGPFYPLYLLWLTPEIGAASWLTALAAPLFLSVPLVSRSNGLSARLMMVIVGLANVLWCSAVLGRDSGVWLFALPCLALSLTLWRSPKLMLGSLGLCLVSLEASLKWPWLALADLTLERQADRMALTATSVGALCACLVLLGAGEFRLGLADEPRS